MDATQLYADSVALYGAYGVELEPAQLSRLRAWCEGERAGVGHNGKQHGVRRTKPMSLTRSAKKYREHKRRVAESATGEVMKHGKGQGP